MDILEMRITIFYAVSVICMITVLMICRKFYDISLLKCALLAVSFGIVGIPSVKIMYYLENGDFSGLSFFGAVFFAPILILPFAHFLRIRYSNAMDLLVAGGIVMNGIFKINCYVSGCCVGRVLFYNNSGIPVRFPSQLIEMAVSFALCILMVMFIRKRLYSGAIYPLFLVVYGVLRFVLNFMREGENVLVGLKVGNVWSLIAVIIGTTWLLIYNLKKNY